MIRIPGNKITIAIDDFASIVDCATQTGTLAYVKHSVSQTKKNQNEKNHKMFLMIFSGQCFIWLSFVFKFRILADSNNAC